MPDRDLPRVRVVGDVVHWFRNADRNNGPVAGIVTQTGVNGVLAMTLWPKDSLTGQPISGVHHINDPWLAERPKARMGTGGWDLMENTPLPEPRKKSPSPAADAALTGGDAIKAEVLRLVDAKKGSVEIAELMAAKTGEPWTHQKVTYIVRHRNDNENVEQEPVTTTA